MSRAFFRAAPGDGDRGDRAPAHCAPEPGGRCSVCGGEGREGVILQVLKVGRTARVRSEGEVMEVALDLLHDVGPGDRVVIHLGFALAVVREGGA